MINNTMYLTGGKSPNPLSPPTNLAAKAGNAQVTLTWTDPPNATSEPSGQTIATWAYTQIVRKQGSQPTGPGDGTLVVKSSVRDQYQTTGYIDTNLTNDTLYYYGAFAYNSDGVYSEGAFVSATPQAGTPLGNLAEGTLITIKENGAPVEFYVSKQNYEPGLNGNGRTLVVRKDVWQNVSWGTTNDDWVVFYTSNLCNVLNTTYKSLFSEKTQELMGSTKYNSSDGPYFYTPSNSVFCLSMRELFPNRISACPVEGETLPIADTLKIANFNGSPSTWYTRTLFTGSFISAWYIDTSGSYNWMYQSGGNNPMGARPCFTLPSTALVDSSNALIES